MKPSAPPPPLAQVLIFAGLLTLLQAGPWLPLLLAKISPVAFAAESVAYRYFHSLRLVHDDPSTIWEAQGQTLGVVQELFQHLLDGLGITALRSRMDLFSYATLALNSLLFGLVAWLLGRTLPAGWRARLLLASTSLISIYGLWWGIFSARLPDYYTVEVTLTFACLGLFMVRHRQPEIMISPLAAAALGVLAGAMVGIKITLLPTALLPVLPTLLSSPLPMRPLLHRAGCWAAAVVATLAIIFVTYYQFDLPHLGRAFLAWRSFVSAPGAEPGFVDSLLHPFAPTNTPWADHRFVPVVLLLWVIALAARILALIAELGRRRHHLILIIFALTGTALHVWTVTKRPAETTLFESALFVTTIAAALLHGLPERTGYRRAATLWLTLAFGWCLFSGPRLFPSAGTLSALKTTSRHAWEIHDWLNAMHRPVVVLLPDNRYVSGTVEETLLKGFSDVPTWNITTGYAMMNSIAPQRLFVTQLSDAPAGSVLVWTDVPGVLPLVDLTAATPRVLGVIPEQVRSWSMQRSEYWSRTVHAAVIPADHDSEAIVLTGNHAWHESTPAAPLAGFSVSPGNADPRFELRTEGGLTVLRVTATKPTPYLAIGGVMPALPPGADTVRLRARVRVDRVRSMLWQLYDNVDAQGTMESVAETVAVCPPDWAGWSIRKQAVRYPSPADSFSVGLTQVQPGDWFEIADLTLLVPAVEPADRK